MSEPSDKARYFVAIILSLIVLFTWTVFSPPSGNQQETTENSSNSEKNSEIFPTPSEALEKNENILDSGILVPEESANEENNNPTETLTATDKPSTKEEFFSLENENLKIKFSSKNAVVDEVFLTYLNEQEKVTTPNIDYSLPDYRVGNVSFRLVDGAPLNRYFQVTEQSANRLVFQTRLTIQSKVIFIIKEYSLQDSVLNLKVRFIDETGNAVKVNYYVSNGSSIGVFKKEKNIFDITEIAYTIGDNTETVLSRGFFSIFGQEENQEIISSIKPDWISIDNRFYLRALKSKSDISEAVFLRKNINQQEHLITAYKLQSNPVDEFSFYLLPKKRDLLDSYYDEQGEYFFNLFHQFKFMRILSSILYFFIQEIYQLVGDYGLAILLITLLLKIIILPLTHKSMKSMKRMQELAPKMQAIRSNFKNNPQKMNLEMMTLYRKEKINPLGGCIPMLIPLPIFIAFYSLFRSMVELQGVPFLWIGDLSLPDVIYQFNSSIFLIGDQIHLLPIIMTVSSFFQSIMTPQTTTPENRQQIIIMKYFLPIFFLFISWNMPSALILFWLSQNLFSIGQMLVIRLNDKNKQLKIKKT